jgi:RecA-family ATPase
MSLPMTPEERLHRMGATIEVPTFDNTDENVHKLPVKPKTNRLQLLSVEDALNAPPRKYLLDDLLAEREMSVWWGKPKCGKSFLLLRLAYGLALGLGMWGKQVRKRCAVIYVAAEGQDGVKGPIKALSDDLGTAPLFRFITQRVDLLDPDADVDPLIARAQGLLDEIEEEDGERPALVLVIDTYHRSAPGCEENSSRDAGRFISNMDKIREETNAHVAIVHHGSAAGERLRGSTAIEGAADLIVKVEKAESGRCALVEAAKDDEDGYRLPFETEVVEIGVDANGKTRHTLLVKDTGSQRNQLPRDRRSESVRE